MAPAFVPLIKRALIFVHRWLGVALCVVFLLWFPSGIGMMYWDFPGVTDADRLEHSPNLDVARIRLSPAEAYARVEEARRRHRSASTRSTAVPCTVSAAATRWSTPTPAKSRSRCRRE